MQSLIYEERASDSPVVESVTHGYTLASASVIRPAEVHWHLVLTEYQGQHFATVVGPWSAAGVASWDEDAEILWIKFKLGTFMPHLPTRDYRNAETRLPTASGNNFWLNGSAWSFPDYENVDTFINRLVRDDVLVCDPVVAAALQDHLPEMASRTLRHRFLQATGLSRTHIHQFNRAQHAATLLQQGVPILDTVFELGYFDQPHLTRSLKQFIGHTPAQIASLGQPA